MNRCTESRRLQDYLDGLMAAAETDAFRVHLHACQGCSAELGAYQRLFHSLDHLPLLDPRPELAERVFAHVLPSRVRRRWILTVGWSYAASLVASLASAYVLATQPVARAWIDALADQASRQVVQSVTFVLNALAFVVVSLAAGWGFLAQALQRLAPIVRALVALLSPPAIELTVWTAGVACAAVLWWMRTREKPSTRNMRHVAVLGV